MSCVLGQYITNECELTFHHCIVLGDMKRDSSYIIISYIIYMYLLDDTMDDRPVGSREAKQRQPHQL